MYTNLEARKYNIELMMLSSDTYDEYMKLLRELINIDIKLDCDDVRRHINRYCSNEVNNLRLKYQKWDSLRFLYSPSMKNRSRYMNTITSNTSDQSVDKNNWRFSRQVIGQED